MLNDIENNNKPTIREWTCDEATYTEINEKEMQRFRIIKWDWCLVGARIINDQTGDSTVVYSSTEKDRKALKAFAIEILKQLD